MRVFVTGSTGLLGNNLVRALLDAEHTVCGLVRSPEKAKRLLGALDVEVVQGDMRDVDGFARALDGCEAVVHTAAYFREYYGPGNHRRALQALNVDAVRTLLAAADARGVKRFVHVSSAGVIGIRPDGSPGDEDTPPSARQLANGYFRSKYAADQAIRVWEPGHGMQVMAVLPGWIWGPWDAAPTGAGQLVCDFINQDMPASFKGGSMVVDARDVATGIVSALELGEQKERYIMGGQYHSLADLLRLLETCTGVAGPRFTLPGPIVMAFAALSEWAAKLTGGKVLVSREAVRVMRSNIRVSSEKAHRDLGVKFRPIEETVRDTVTWFRNHPDCLNGHG